MEPIYHQMIHEKLTLLTQIFPNLDMEKKIQEGMFKRPNIKGMQTVFYSLISILSPDYCKKCIPWPIGFSSDNYKFRTAIINFITKECPDFDVPPLLPSLLNKTDGEKYVKFIFNFSSYVIKIVSKKKYGQPLLEKCTVNGEDSTKLFEDLTRAELHEAEQYYVKYTEFLHNNRRLLKLKENELENAFQKKREQRQTLATELAELGLTKVTDKEAIDSAINGVEQQVTRLQRDLHERELKLEQILSRQLYRIRLQSMKKSLESAVMDNDSLVATLNSDFSEAVQVPLNTVMAELFPNENNQVCLKMFIKFGRLIVNSHMQRFLQLNPVEKPLTSEMANEVFVSVVDRLKRLASLETEISNCTKYCEEGLSCLKNPNQDYNNDPYFDLFAQLQMLGNFKPQINKHTNSNLLSRLFGDRGEDIIDNPVNKLKDMIIQSPE